jgi:hypothetical protein
MAPHSASLSDLLAQMRDASLALDERRDALLAALVCDLSSQIDAVLQGAGAGLRVGEWSYDLASNRLSLAILLASGTPAAAAPSSPARQPAPAALPAPAASAAPGRPEAPKAAPATSARPVVAKPRVGGRKMFATTPDAPNRFAESTDAGPRASQLARAMVTDLALLHADWASAAITLSEADLRKLIEPAITPISQDYSRRVGAAAVEKRYLEDALNDIICGGRRLF